MVFPELAGVVKKNPGNEQIAVQSGIKLRHLLRDAHHLGGVLDQAAAPGVMIVAGRGGAAEALAILGDEFGAQGAQPGIVNRRGRGDNKIPIGFLFLPQLRRALQKLRLFLVRQGTNLPAADIEAELLMLIEFARQAR